MSCLEFHPIESTLSYYLGQWGACRGRPTGRPLQGLGRGRPGHWFAPWKRREMIPRRGRRLTRWRPLLSPSENDLANYWRNARYTFDWDDWPGANCYRSKVDLGITCIDSRAVSFFGNIICRDKIGIWSSNHQTKRSEDHTRWFVLTCAETYNNLWDALRSALVVRLWHHRGGKMFRHLIFVSAIFTLAVLIFWPCTCKIAKITVLVTNCKRYCAHKIVLREAAK